MATYRTKMYDRLDRICHARYGATTQHIVEFVIEANPDIEQHGFLLPPGIIINLPEPTVTVKKAPVLKQVFLWD